MLIKKFGPTNKGKQRLCLITDALSPIKEPYEGTKEDQIDMISAQMKSHGVKFDCIVVRENLPGAANQSILDENDLLLNRFSKKTAAKVIHVESATSLLGALRTRNISPVTIFRGDLELSPLMKIKVRFKLTAGMRGQIMTIAIHVLFHIQLNSTIDMPCSILDLNDGVLGELILFYLEIC